MVIRKIFFHLILPLLVATSGFAQDTIVLNNGDILTGEILKQTTEQVYFKSLIFGSVSLKPSDIAEIHTQNEKPNPVATPSKTNLPPEQITTLLAKNGPETKKQWTGQAGMAIAMRESNTLQLSGGTVIEKQESFETYRIYGNVNWEGKQNDLRWDWTYRYSASDLRKDDDFLNITQNYKHNFKEKNYFAAAKTLYQRDYRRKIEHEYLQTAEMGIKWFDRSKFQLSTSAGGGYHKYDRLIYNNTINAVEEVTVAEPKFIFDQSLRWQMINSLTLIQKYTHLGDLGNLENYHLVFSAGLENKLIRDLFLRLEYRVDHDTEVSYDDKSYYDKALLTSLLYKF